MGGGQPQKTPEVPASQLQSKQQLEWQNQIVEISWGFLSYFHSLSQLY